jgi:hypothetical protein
MATHFVELEHEMVRNSPNPPGTLATDQVEPPSWLTNRLAPTAIHVVAVGQATSPTPPALVGNVTCCHVVPSSVERTMAPASLP